MRVLLLAVAVSMVPVAGAEVERALADAGWRELTFDGKAPNRWLQRDAETIGVISDDSVSVLYRPLDVDLSERPCLRWAWRVDEPAPATDLAVKGGDDRSLAIYVSFPYQAEHASLWEQIKRPLVEMAEGEDAPGRVLIYTWGGVGARGDRPPSPYLGSAGVQTILRPAGTATGQWFQEEVHVREFFREAFAYRPDNPTQLAVSADSDDTDSRVVARVRDLRFTDCVRADTPG